MGSLEDHKGFRALHPQFWRARTANGARGAAPPKLFFPSKI